MANNFIQANLLRGYEFVIPMPMFLKNLEEFAYGDLEDDEKVLIVSRNIFHRNVKISNIRLNILNVFSNLLVFYDDEKILLIRCDVDKMDLPDEAKNIFKKHFTLEQQEKKKKEK